MVREDKSGGLHCHPDWHAMGFISTLALILISADRSGRVDRWARTAERLEEHVLARAWRRMSRLMLHSSGLVHVGSICRTARASICAEIFAAAQVNLDRAACGM